MTAFLDRTLALAAGGEHLDDGLAQRRRQIFVGRRARHHVAGDREAGKARVHDEEHMLGANAIADPPELVHRDGRQWQRARVGIDRQQVALVAGLRALRLAVPGEEHEEPVLVAHLRELAVEHLLDARFRRLAVEEDADVLSRKAETGQRRGDRLGVGDGIVEARRDVLVRVDADHQGPRARVQAVARLSSRGRREEHEQGQRPEDGREHGHRR